MPHFEFKGRGSNGQLVDGEIEGTNQSAVAGLLMDRGVIPIFAPRYRSSVPEIVPVTLSSPSTIVLILANLVPIVGALFLDWNLGNVLVREPVSAGRITALSPRAIERSMLGIR